MKKGSLYVLLCYILWGILPIFWKQIGGVNSYYILAARMVWSFIFCGIIMIAKREFFKLKSILKNKKLLKKLIIAGILLIINWGFYIVAVNKNKLIDASLAYYLNPILTVLLGFLIFKERLSKRQWIAIIVAILGISFQLFTLGEFPTYAVIIGGSFALYGAVKKDIKLDSEVSIFMELFFLLPFAIIFIIYAKSKGIDGVDSLVGFRKIYIPLTGVVTAFPLLLYSIGIQSTKLTTAGLLMYINPTLQLLLAVAVYGESFTRESLVVFISVIIALLIYIPTVYNKTEVEVKDES